MGIKELFEGIKDKRKRYQEFEDDARFHKRFEQKQKNSNERELERFYEEERQENIKRELEAYRKRRQDEMWKSNMLSNKNEWNKERPILKERNIFSLRGDSFR